MSYPDCNFSIFRSLVIIQAHKLHCTLAGEVAGNRYGAPKPAAALKSGQATEEWAQPEISQLHTPYRPPPRSSWTQGRTIRPPWMSSWTWPTHGTTRGRRTATAHSAGRKNRADSNPPGWDVWLRGHKHINSGPHRPGWPRDKESEHIFRLYFHTTIYWVVIGIHSNYKLDLSTGGFADLLGYDKKVLNTSNNVGAHVPDIMRSMHLIYIHWGQWFAYRCAHASLGQLPILKGALPPSVAFGEEAPNLTLYNIRTTDGPNNALDMIDLDVALSVIIEEDKCFFTRRYRDVSPEWVGQFLQQTVYNKIQQQGHKGRKRCPNSDWLAIGLNPEKERHKGGCQSKWPCHGKDWAESWQNPRSSDAQGCGKGVKAILRRRSNVQKTVHTSAPAKCAGTTCQSEKTQCWCSAESWPTVSKQRSFWAAVLWIFCHEYIRRTMFRSDK